MTPPQTLNPRQTLLWSLFDFSLGRGLEIGPLHNTAVPQEHADVRYLDVFDRDQLVANYADDPGVPTDAIPDIDYVLSAGGRVRSIPETIGDVERFDWVMASHVIEHVPDVIGWLEDIATIVVDGGALVLAVPDRRYCFDLHRPGTTVGQMLQAHELRETVPSVRAVYDYKRGHASVRAPMVWANKLVGYENRIFALDLVRSLVERARQGEYIDSHVWLFTPGTLLEQIIELRTLGLAEWRVETLVPTKHNQLEFYAVLRRLPRGSDWDPELLADEPVPGRMPDWLIETTQAARDRDAAREQVLTLRTELDDARSETRAQSARIAELTTQLQRARRGPADRSMSRATWLRVKRRIRRMPGFRFVRSVVPRR